MPMSQSTRSDQSQGQSQGMVPEMMSDAALQQVTSERNSLRSQNDQLWKIIEKQRVIIQNLQKDVAKVTAERDLLRASVPVLTSGSSDASAALPLSDVGQPSFAQDQSVMSHQYQPQPNGHPFPQQGHQSSKRSMDRKPQEVESSGLELSGFSGGERESELALGFNPNSSFSSTTSSTTDHRHIQQQPRQLPQDRHSPRQHRAQGQPVTLPLTPSSTCAGDLNGKAELDEEEPIYDNSNIHHHEDIVQPSPTVGLQQHQSPVAHLEREARTGSSRSESGNTINGNNSNLGRNISGNIAIPPHLMPHLPPRSPRRERRDDYAGSPDNSDNDEETLPVPVGSRRKPAVTGPIVTPTRTKSDFDTDHTVPASPSAQRLEHDTQDSYGSSISRGQNLDYDSSLQHSTGATPGSTTPVKSVFQVSPATATRKTVSGHIPIIPTGLSSGPGDAGPASPTGGIGSNAASPIAAIIDQDAEKFRVYMNKLSSPNRKQALGPAPGGAESQDHAAALGQAVAMETIQAQIEIQQQLVGQTQGLGSRGGPNSVYAQDQWNARPSNLVNGGLEAGSNGSMDTLGNPEVHRSNESFPQDEQGETRERRRQSSLPAFENYPKIAVRSTSQRGDEDDGSREFAPLPPKRYDSQPMLDQQSIARSASPTPSGNSSLSNTLTTPASAGYSRSGQFNHQQAFSMFGDNLDTICVTVVGSNIKTNDKGKELLTFLVSIRQEGGDEMWRVEKQYMDFVNLDSKLRITQSRNIINSLPRVPDKSLFSTHAPSKVDMRKLALEQFLQQLTSLRIKDTRDLCEFLSTNVVEQKGGSKGGNDQGWKEGYLTKRGKNFGGWKTRYFSLKGPVLEYFDTKDGHHLGSIVLTYAQIGRQQAQEKPQDGTGDSKEGPVDPNSYRHAFLILEPKKGMAADVKRNPNNVTRHVLCAETDQERDEWVDALLLYVGKEPAEQQESNEKDRSARKLPEIQKMGATPIRELASVKGNEKLLLNQEAYERQQRSVPPSPSAQQFQSQARGASVPQSPTTQGMALDDRHSQDRQSAEDQYPANSRSQNYNQFAEQDSQSGSWGGQQPSQQYHQHQQGYQHQHQYQQQQQVTQQLPRNQSTHSLTQDEAMLKPSGEVPSSAAHLSSAEVAEKKQKSRMTFHWPKKVTKEDTPAQMPPIQPGSKDALGNPAGNDSSRLRNFLGKGHHSSVGAQAPGQGTNSGNYPHLAPIRQVFGVSLEQAVDQARVQPGYELPAVVYRCIEYLNAHKAKLEEGIYRLNGSSAVIKNLKDRFNHDGDVPLLASDEYYDIHAVAGLLKLFLRDLPSSVLTRELHKDFLQVIELSNRVDRVQELTRLVSVLPEANYTLLRALTAHLIEIVENADVNKMTARNVGIVFSPTLGIPAGVFSLLMSDFDEIFDTKDGRIMPLENSDLHGIRMAESNVTSDAMMMA
ncbi:RalA-binding protein 1 [Entomortierella parvispora]|uniref:RalA-binding protein 1 n=1 Tax=Entomortierella parvispora TaxID=205924 RepID=A0A9P3LSP6_9FUNG|nr:RalA-binding protein 1 [Entomortierella parvispora]